MGTKLRYAINSVASASKNSNLANYQVGDCGYSQEVVQKDQIDPSSSLMEGKVFDLQKIESIRKTMLMQNDIFQQQVIELHRLYEHQKKMMHELKKEASSDINIWHQMPMQEMEPGCFGGGSRDEAPSTSTRNGFIESNSNQTCKASYGLENVNKKCNMLNNDEEEVDVELSLSIGCSSKKRSKSNGPHHRMASCSMDLGSSETYSNGGGGLSSCAINKRDSREKSLGGDSGLVLSNSNGKMNQNVPNSIWFFSRS